MMSYYKNKRVLTKIISHYFILQHVYGSVLTQQCRQRWASMRPMHRCCFTWSGPMWRCASMWTWPTWAGWHGLSTHCSSHLFSLCSSSLASMRHRCWLISIDYGITYASLWRMHSRIASLLRVFATWWQHCGMLMVGFGMVSSMKMECSMVMPWHQAIYHGSHRPWKVLEFECCLQCLIFQSALKIYNFPWKCLKMTL